jgi:hypothetical protein
LPRIDKASWFTGGILLKNRSWAHCRQQRAGVRFCPWQLQRSGNSMNDKRAFPYWHFARERRGSFGWWVRQLSRASVKASTDTQSGLLGWHT